MAGKLLKRTKGEPAEEHSVPATNEADRQHELTATCWCKPTVTKVWEGTEYERHVHQHYNSYKKPATKRAAKKAAPKPRGK